MLGPASDVEVIPTTTTVLHTYLFTVSRDFSDRDNVDLTSSHEVDYIYTVWFVMGMIL